MSFSFRAQRIMEDTLNALQQAEELDGVQDLEEYARMMMVLAENIEQRAQVAIDRLLEGEQ